MADVRAQRERDQEKEKVALDDLSEEVYLSLAQERERRVAKWRHMEELV